MATIEPVNMVQNRSGSANLFFAMINQTKNVAKAKLPNNVISTAFLHDETSLSTSTSVRVVISIHRVAEC